MITDIRQLLHRRGTAPETRKHRDAGDAARNRRDWAEAEASYKVHLSIAPDDQPIWVQYGHSLKEQGKVAEAETAYQRAVKLQPDDADAHLQLGHALKLLNRTSDAASAYRTSLELQPSKATYDELIALGSLEDAQEVVRSSVASDVEGTVYLEIDDLFNYLRSHKTLSGIQRVQVGIVQHALAELQDRNEPYVFVVTGKHASGLWRLDAADVRALTDYLGKANISQDRLLSLIISAEQRAIYLEPAAGRTYFVLGAFWGFGANAARYTKLKRAGVRVGVYIYDLIPITHPEYCASGLVTEFTFALGDGLCSFDFIMTISAFVAQDVKRFLKKHRLREIPVEPVLLAHELNKHPPLPPAERWPKSIARLKDRPFVLMVSTIEARKNHAYLFAIWKALIEEGLEPPDLVFVGRFGWRVNDFHDMLHATRFLDGRIHVLHDLSDVDLEMLYQSCMFTAFPSITEGWGLPVGESLTHGRPCIASNTSSVPEVGGDLVDYVDPWNVRDGIRVFKKMIFDDAYRAQRTQQIKETFVPRTWDVVGAELLQRLKSLRDASNSTYLPPLLPAGEFLVPGELCLLATVDPDYPSRPLRPIFAESWYPAEPFGAWLRGNDGFLWFRSDCSPGAEVVVYLHLLGAPWDVDHTVAIHVGKQAGQTDMDKVSDDGFQDGAAIFRLHPDGPTLARVSGMVEADGSIFIQFHVEGTVVTGHPAKSPDDDRVFYVGLARMAYVAAEDNGMRSALLERFASINNDRVSLASVCADV